MRNMIKLDAHGEMLMQQYRDLRPTLEHLSEEAYDLIADAGYKMADMPSSDSVWSAVLRQHGFYRKAIPNFCPDCYTTADFAKDHPHGTYVLAFGGHVATVKDGVLLDAWNSSNLIPQYYFYRKDD